MNKFILISVFSFFLAVDVNSQTTGWSSWTNCAETEGCFQRRIFTCGAGERLECLNETNEGFEQLAVNCSASPECLENIAETFYPHEVCTVYIDSSGVELILQTIERQCIKLGFKPIISIKVLPA